MAQPSAEQLAQKTLDLGLLDDWQLRDVWATLGSRNVSPDDLLQLLLRREILTNYQVERLLKGGNTGFFFGDYKVLYLVGAGSFARVYRAVHKETGRVVAVKVLRTRYSETPAQYGQFVREGKVGCTLRHPNIVPIYEVESRGKTHFLVMAFVEGQNLQDFVRIRKRLEPMEAAKLMADICAGMQYAFENGLTHRDLKMNNVLVSSRGQAKLVDFGLAAVEDGMTDDSLADLPNARTVDYAGLERATGVRKDDPRSDIYFLGCIFYNMLSGQPPLSETRDRVQRLSKQRFLEVPAVRKVAPSVPGAMAMIVNKAMMLDAERRYQSPGAMLHDLRLATRRLRDQKQTGDSDVSKPNTPAPVVAPEDQTSVMIVESNAQMQDIFRQGFKRAGYRVLLTSDPLRARDRLQQDPTAVEQVVFNAQELGEAAVAMFNDFGKDAQLASIPAILLLDEEQGHWRRKAETAAHRVVLSMPLTMKQLRAALVQLVPPTPSS